MPTAMRQAPANAASGGKSKLAAVQGMPTERWAAIIMIAALLFLILIRRGFRGVNVLGVRAGV